MTCTTKTGRLDEDATVKVTGTGGSATVAVHAGETLAEVAEAIDALRSTTGVAASVNENTKALALSSIVTGSGAIVRTPPTSGLWQTEGLDSSGTARGQDELNVGLHFLIPGLVLVVGVWVSYRVVNFPAFADFLIAVEAEMNKVSWPTRTELIRASYGVILLVILIFDLGVHPFGMIRLSAGPCCVRKVLHIFYGISA